MSYTVKELLEVAKEPPFHYFIHDGMTHEFAPTAFKKVKYFEHSPSEHEKTVYNGGLASRTFDVKHLNEIGTRRKLINHTDKLDIEKNNAGTYIITKK